MLLVSEKMHSILLNIVYKKKLVTTDPILGSHLLCVRSKILPLMSFKNFQLVDSLPLFSLEFTIVFVEITISRGAKISMVNTKVATNKDWFELVWGDSGGEYDNADLENITNTYSQCIRNNLASFRTEWFLGQTVIINYR